MGRSGLSARLVGHVRNGPQSAEVIHRSYPQAPSFPVKHDVDGLHCLWMKRWTKAHSSVRFHVKRQTMLTRVHTHRPVDRPVQNLEFRFRWLAGATSPAVKAGDMAGGR
jgi:hypothetical protein